MSADAEGGPSMRGRNQINDYLKRIDRYHRGAFSKLGKHLLTVDTRGLPIRFTAGSDTPEITTYTVPLSTSTILLVGLIMESMENALKSINAEVQESADALQGLANEIGALADLVGPKLIQQIREIRDSRMAIVREVREALSALRDVRQFFLESDHETGVARMERLVKLCREFQELKQSGVLDAVTDTALRLAVGGNKS